MLTVMALTIVMRGRIVVVWCEVMGITMVILVLMARVVLWRYAAATAGESHMIK